MPPDHDLRRVKPCIDVERCRALVTDGYSPAMGRTVDGDRRALRVDADRARRTARNLLPGTGDEARETQTRRAAAERAQGQAVAAVALDGMGGHGEVLQAWSAPAGRGVAVDVPPPALAQTPWFGPAAFLLAAARGVVTWPGGPQTATTERRANHTGGTLVLPRRQWVRCRQPARCLATRPQKTGRRVIKPDDQADDDAAWVRATPPRDAAVRQQPPRGERTRAARVRDHDGRRSRYRGQGRVQMQELLTGLVVNAQRRVQRLRPQGAPRAPQLVDSSSCRGTHAVGAHARRRTQTWWSSCPSTGRAAWLSCACLTQHVDGPSRASTTF